jgi:beta-lactamase superfamily II metal-dependent hydrolase
VRLQSPQQDFGEWLHAVRAEIGVISVGAGNTYGHPTPEVLDRLNGNGVSVYRTDLDGNVKVTTDGVNYQVITSSIP